MVMEVKWSESRLEQKERNDRSLSPAKELKEGRQFDDLEHDENDKSSKHRSRRKISTVGEEKSHKGKDRERSKKSTDDVPKERENGGKDLEKSKVSSRDRKREDRDERDKDRSRDTKVRMKDYDQVRVKDYDREKHKEKERDRETDRMDRGKEKDREREREVERDNDRGREKDKGKEKRREKDKERDRVKEAEREKDREKHNDRDKEKETYKDTGKEKIREKERGELNREKIRDRDRDRVGGKSNEASNDGVKDAEKSEKFTSDDEDGRGSDVSKQGKVYQHATVEEDSQRINGDSRVSGSEIKERIRNMKEERLRNKSENASEVLSWVSRSRKLEEKRNVEKDRALQLSKIFEEQDKIDRDDSDEEATLHSNDLAGVKVLHGLEKVLEGGAVVLTLKDQSILADGDVNEEVDMLENIEIGEQKRRNEAYKAAKKKTGIYDDKFNDEPDSEKKILPQYDDPAVDEGITLDERGRISGEAEKKLAELRRRIEGGSTNSHFEDLNISEKISHDYFTQEEMIQFKKPKKKKSLRKKEKLDINALEAEAIAAGLGAGDLGSRKDSRRESIKEEQERSEAERRNNAYQSAYAKAEEASKLLRLDKTLPLKSEETESTFIADDDEDLRKSLERARKLALKKPEDVASGLHSVALLAAATSSSHAADDKNLDAGELKENEVVTEMKEFLSGLQLDKEAQDEKHDFMYEEEAPKTPDTDRMEEDGRWTEVNETVIEVPNSEEGEDIVPDEIIHEVAIGKGLSGALMLLKDRGTLKETVEWGGRNMDKKKSKLVGIVGEDKSKESKSNESRPPSFVDHKKEINIERTDEFGRILTPKEAFRQLSHKFHGKGPGKMKQEKRMKQYHEELKLKQMKNSDTPSLSVERMREAQAQLKTPYLVLSGHVKPGQTSDPRSGFATVEKDLPGGLTPMLGDKKVEHFLGIKRRSENTNSGMQKKPRT